MTSILGIIIQEYTVDNEVVWHLTSTGWSAINAISTTIGTVVVIASAALALKGMKENRSINQENNDIQKDRILQERLIELSHEWNSKDFIAARNHAALLKKEFKGREGRAYAVLCSNGRIESWIYISMIAHFFERLSYIQLSKQIYRKNAYPEFHEAIDYWHDFLCDVYLFDDKNESRIRKALTALRDEYQKDENESQIP